MVGGVHMKKISCSLIHDGFPLTAQLDVFVCVWRLLGKKLAPMSVDTHFCPPFAVWLLFRFGGTVVERDSKAA